MKGEGGGGGRVGPNFALHVKIIKELKKFSFFVQFCMHTRVLYTCFINV